MIDIKQIQEQLLALPNVVGVGIGFKTTGGQLVLDEDGNPVECIVVSVTAKVDRDQLSPDDAVPAAMDDDITDVVETGPIRLISDLPADEIEIAAIDPTQRYRPITPGISIGLNPGVTAGTLGFIVEKGETAARYILSNWHVIAANNTPVADRSVTTITQPGNADGGSPPSDVVANLSDIAPIVSSGGSPIPIPSECGIAGAAADTLNFVAKIVGSGTRLAPVLEALSEHDETTENEVDAALGEINVAYDRQTPEIGVVTESSTPTLGMQVQKFGRTTSHTTGTISQVNATFVVQGYPDGPATFVDQVAITGSSGSFLAGGDSGSGLTTMDAKAVGLCFAGSEAIGIANTWRNVSSALGIALARS